MVTVDDLIPGEALPEPITVKVINVDWNPGRSRRAELNLVDRAGNALNLVDYDGAELAVEWAANHRYRISGCSAFNSAPDAIITLAPSKRTQVDALGPVADATSLLVVGDTHVGRTAHPKTKAAIDPIGAFAAAVEHGIECGVDAVVHVGDIFHESVSTKQANAVDRRVFARLADAGTRFYFVRGNHSADPGNRVLANRSGVSTLDTTGDRVGSELRVFGIDHDADGALPWATLQAADTSAESCRILVLHQTLQQLSGAGERSVDLRDIRRYAPARFDFVLSGHHHDATIRDWHGTTVMYTGASERMSMNANPTERVAWLVAADGTSVSLDRYDIP